MKNIKNIKKIYNTFFFLHRLLIRVYRALLGEWSNFLHLKYTQTYEKLNIIHQSEHGESLKTYTKSIQSIQNDRKIYIFVAT